MCKWCRPPGIFAPFKDHLSETYAFPCGWGGVKLSFEAHLQNFRQGGFDGADALRAAKHWVTLQATAKKEKDQHQARAAAFAAQHAPAARAPTPRWTPSPPPPRRLQRFLPSESDSDEGLFETPGKRRCTTPAWLRGVIAVFGHQVETVAGSERYSADDRKKALAILELGEGVCEVELKKAFRTQALKCHPDKVQPHNRAWATQEMQQLNWAFKFLSSH